MTWKRFNHLDRLLMVAAFDGHYGFSCLLYPNKIYQFSFGLITTLATDRSPKETSEKLHQSWWHCRYIEFDTGIGTPRVKALMGLLEHDCPLFKPGYQLSGQKYHAND
jgi:hypothetical protein